VLLLLLVSLLLVGTSFEGELGFNLPCVVGDVVYIQVLVRIIPSHHVQEAVVAEDIVGEGAYLWQVHFTLHQVLLRIEFETF